MPAPPHGRRTREGAQVIVLEIPGDIAKSDTLAQQIRDALADRILSGQLSPGTRLKDNEVAAMFGTSNTPAREALRLLARDGLVDILPYRGCVVRPVDLREVSEILDMHAVIAGYAARVAASCLTEEQWRDLEAAVEEYGRALAAGEHEGAMQAASRFHGIVVDAVGNRILAQMYRYLSNRIRLAHRACMQALIEGTPYHELLAAMRAGDGARAEAIIAEHVAQSRQRVAEALVAGTNNPSEPCQDS